jgi:hypothetical protein
MEALNLNSEVYTDSEIEELFHLKQPYNIADITKARQILNQQLIQNDNLGSEKQREIAFFIDTISTRMQNKVTNNISGLHKMSQYGNNFLIENPDRIAGQASKFENGRMALETKTMPPGYMNPINVRTITQAISLDSRFRPNYYGTKSTNYGVVLPAIQKNVVSMRVTSIEIPITWYAISRNSGNSVCLFIDLNDTTHGWLLTLPDGNYEQSWAGNSKAAYIELAMNAAIADAVPVTIDANGMVTANPGGSGTPLTSADLIYDVNRASGRSLFKAVAGGIFDSNGFILRFNIDNNGSLNMDVNIQLRLGWQLGFRAAEYTVTSVDGAVSEGICLISGPRYGFISIDDYQKNTGPSFVIAYANSVLQDNIISRINFAELLADTGVYQSSSDPGLSTQLNRTREYFGPVDIQRLHIAVYDEFGRVIDLNNMDWSITLAFELLYN